MKDTKNYTIKEVAKLSGLPESTLRYYETIGLIDPIGRDPNSKHRVYSEDELNLAIGISCLNATGMSIEEMRAYLSNWHRGSRAAKQQITLLETQERRLTQEAQYLKLRRRYVAIKIDYWKAVESKDPKKIEAAGLAAQMVVKEMQANKERR